MRYYLPSTNIFDNVALGREIEGWEYFSKRADIGGLQNMIPVHVVDCSAKKWVIIHFYPNFLGLQYIGDIPFVYYRVFGIRIGVCRSCIFHSKSGDSLSHLRNDMRILRESKIVVKVSLTYYLIYCLIFFGADLPLYLLRIWDANIKNTSRIAIPLIKA